MLRSLARFGAALTLLATLASGASAQGNTQDISGTTEDTPPVPPATDPTPAPTALLPLFTTPAAPDCALAGTAEPYEATPFTVAPDGTYAFSIVDPIDTGFGDDTIVIVYEAPFDPNNGCDNFVAIGNETPGSGLTVDLEASKSYVLVVAGMFGSQDDYTIRISGPEACTISSPLVISAFTTSETTVDNTSAGSAVDLSACTVAAYDGYTELVTAASDPTDVLAPSTSLPVALTAPAGPGAVVVAATDLVVGSTVGDAAGSVVAAIVYDATGAIYVASDGTRGECGNGPGVNACNSPAGGAAVARAMAALFGGAVAGEGGGTIALDVTVAPNPSAGRSAIRYGLAEAGDVRVSVFDALGREVAVLAVGPRGPGRHEAALDASALPAGAYIARVAAGAEVRTSRFTVAR